MKNSLFYFLLTLTQFPSLDAQPDSRFRPFDWVLYRGAGSISSISEGYTYAYIGTESGGLKRFDLFGQAFDDPITTAQGLHDNHVTAVHFDMQTGNIWVATPRHIQYSFSREGDWYPIELDYLGLSKYDLGSIFVGCLPACWVSQLAKNQFAFLLPFRNIIMHIQFAALVTTAAAGGTVGLT